MSEPFNFNTPITDNTTLVARYRCGEAPYAGKWFRVTDSTGKSYIPTSLDEAKKAFTGANGYTSVTLLNTSTGEITTLSGKTISKIELGGGWDGYDPPNGSSGSWYIYLNGTSIVISGYAEGLKNPNFYFITTGSNAQIFFDNFKFDSSQFPKLVGSGHNETFSNSNASSTTTRTNGKFGIIEPLDPPDGLTDQINLFAVIGDYRNSSITYQNGFGFTGPYAQQWVDTFPPLKDNYYRKTYIA